MESAFGDSLGGLVVISTSPIYTKKDGWANVTLITDEGYPNATWPSETKKQTKKFHLFHCLVVPKVMLSIRT